jgi:hypothetical protein
VDRNLRALGIGALAALAAAPVDVVVATEYLSVEQAQRLVFPQADAFDELQLALTVAQKQQVVALAGPQVAHRSLRIWRARRAQQLVGYVFIDEVLGREQFITYALGIDASGTLRPVEVLAYRESHGGEVRNAAWRGQFAGKRGLEELRFRTDIQNIAGATLSCEHLTQGVRWLTALWQTALARSGS